MFDVTHLFISSAMAADAVVPGVAGAATDAASVTMVGEPSSWVRFLPLFLIFAVFYFLLIRPQQKKLEEQTQTLKTLKKGDKIVTGGGLVGTISKVEKDDLYLMVEIAKDVQVKVLRSTVSGLVPEAKAVEPKKS